MQAHIRTFLVNLTPDGIDDLTAEIEFQPDTEIEHGQLVALLDEAHLAGAVLTPQHVNNVLKVKVFIPSELPKPAAELTLDEHIELAEHALEMLRNEKKKQEQNQAN